MWPGAEGGHLLVAFRCSALRWHLTDSLGRLTSSLLTGTWFMHTRCVLCSISSVNEVTMASAHGGCRMHLPRVVKPTKQASTLTFPLEKPHWSGHPCRMKSFTLAVLANNHESVRLLACNKTKTVLGQQTAAQQLCRKTD